MSFSPLQQLHPWVKIAFSTAEDGSMASGGAMPSSPEHAKNVERFLRRHDFPTERTRIYATYASDRTYTDVVRLTDSNAGGDIVCDALYTTEIAQVITLPVGDCIATIVYDPVTNLLGVLHLGRHASVAGLIESFAIEIADNVGSDPRDWLVWMSPSIRAENDRLDYFTPPNPEDWREFMTQKDGKIHIDNVGYNRSRFIRAGVHPHNIAISLLNTYIDKRFYSHRAATEQNDPSRQGRMMVAACLIKII